MTPTVTISLAGTAATILTTCFIAAIKGIWKLATSVSTVATKVDLMLTNHLPHLETDIKDLRSELREHIEHINRGLE